MAARTLRIRYESPEAFARAWNDSLSRGAVFVHVADPPPLQACVNVALDLAFAAAKATLEGEVVQQVPASAGTGAGVGVHLTAPLAKIHGAFERFLPQAPIDLDEPVAEDEPPAAPRAAAASAEVDPDTISDSDLAAVLGGAATEDAPNARAPRRPSAPGEAGARLLDPADPFTHFDPHARVLEESDPEPERNPSSLPPDGVAYDPHEIELE